MTSNAGGSALLSEVFGFETLARAEGASLLKTESEIVYSQVGPVVDLLVQMGEAKVGVSIMRAVTYPFETPPSVSTIKALLTAKLADLKTASANVSAADKWDRSVLVVMAYDTAHADAGQTAWSQLDAAAKGDAVVYVVRTDGSDLPLYAS